MKARALILTVGISVTLTAPAALSANTARHAGSCASSARHGGSSADASPQSPFAWRTTRNLQFVVVGDGAATNSAVRVPCGLEAIEPAVAPNRYQVLRNSL